MELKHDFSSDRNLLLPELAQALERLDSQFGDLDAVVLTSKDPHLSEYVPSENNPRYGATRFSGSVGDAIYFTRAFRASRPALKPVVLFVDGRYHLQADQETDPNWVEVVKMRVEPDIEGSLRERLCAEGAQHVGLDFERTSVQSLKNYQEALARTGAQLKPIEGATVLRALGLPGWKVNRPIYSLAKTHTGRTLATNLRALSIALHERTGHTGSLHLTAATDDAAFLLNARGFHLPSTASFLAYTFSFQNQLILFLPEASQDAPVELDPAQFGEFEVRVIRNSISELKSVLQTFPVKSIFYHARSMNGLLPTMASEIFPEASVGSDFNWILTTRTRKTPEEMVSIRSAFIRSSRAIAKTLRFGKTESQKRPLSEWELAEYLKTAYAEEGAIALSFSTISGAGPNSAIVHYSKPSRNDFFTSGRLALLDSGAYYENGFCTDCTRGFFAGSGSLRPEPWQTEIYTLTLKAAIQPFLGPVDASWSGKQVDAWVRSMVKEGGYDYLHGTGHGIGILVHEEGIRLSTLSIYGQSDYACVSVEPGIYLEGKGGVRVENVALLIPEGKTHYRYENVVYVGYDWDLIDVTRLSEAEKHYLKTYEAHCRELGTTLTECPL